MNRAGTMDIGTVCLDVIGSGTLDLQVQMKVHIDSGGTRDCTQLRQDTNATSAADLGSVAFFARNDSFPGVVDPCRGNHTTPL